MSATVIIIWDYDTAIGQVNASYPYNFRESVLLDEIANVDTILALGSEFDVRMTFACVGFAAEPGHYPYHVPDQIARIAAAGHEVASHSWRHEWLPYLQREQLVRTMARSKMVLEACTGKPVRGFVPPFSRPMSWYRRGAISLGDRVFGPWYPGANLTSVCKLLREAGYDWCRVSYRSLAQKLGGDRRVIDFLAPGVDRVAGIACLRQHYTGFDEPAQEILVRAVEQGRSLVLVGHPSGLSRRGAEHLTHLRSMLSLIAAYQQQGVLRAVTASEHLSEAHG
jgi:peptidoglycan/xylan/chitin deacetylase (PgdA/CDA1 family)